MAKYGVTRINFEAAPASAATLELSIACKSSGVFEDQLCSSKQNPHPRASVLLFIACGTWLIGLATFFIVARPALLREDVRYIGTSLRDIRSAVPGLEPWLRRVFAVLGGFIAGTGVLTISVAVSSAATRHRWTSAALGLAGLLTVGTMSVTNFVIVSTFKLLLLIAVQALAHQSQLRHCEAVTMASRISQDLTTPTTYAYHGGRLMLQKRRRG